MNAQKDIGTQAMADKLKPNYGIAISTYNRPDVLSETIDAFLSDLVPEEVPIFLVDDASDLPLPENARNAVEIGRIILHTMPKRSGISAVKNKCIELLYDFQPEASHFFLFDDDTKPVAPDWHAIYINSPYPHHCYTFGNNTPYRKRDAHGYIIRKDFGNGCMIHVTREAVDTIGGFDTELQNLYEHTEYSLRAYNAGLIPAPFIDHYTSAQLLYCKDQEREFNRTRGTISKAEKRDIMAKLHALYYKKILDKHFKPFRSDP